MSLQSSHSQAQTASTESADECVSELTATADEGDDDQPLAIAPNIDTIGEPSQEISRFTPSQRLWVFGFLFQAMAIMDRPPEDISSEVIRKTISLLLQHSDLTGIASSPPARFIKTVWQAFMESGSLRRPNKGGRPENELKHAAEALLKDYSQDLSLREISRELNAHDLGQKISTSTIFRCSKKNQMRFYRSGLCQVLSDDSIARRLNFAHTIRRMVREGSLKETNIIFSDESMIGIGSHVNRQNDGYWRVAGEFEWEQVLQERNFQGPRVHVFVAINAELGIIGPYYVDEIERLPGERDTLNATSYQTLLRTQVVPEIKRLCEIKRKPFNQFWWQQDGAPQHTAASTINYLKSVFDSRIISNKSEFVWPPYSPDLSLLDFWFWSKVKKEMGEHLPADTAEIKTVVPKVALETNLDEIKAASRDFLLRIQALIMHEGGHFEKGFHDFKRYLIDRANICAICGEKHPLDWVRCDVA